MRKIMLAQKAGTDTEIVWGRMTYPKTCLWFNPNARADSHWDLSTASTYSQLFRRWSSLREIIMPMPCKICTSATRMTIVTSMTPVS